MPQSIKKFMEVGVNGENGNNALYPVVGRIKNGFVLVTTQFPNLEEMIAPQILLVQQK